MNLAPAGWPVYSIYGVTLTSDFPFTVPLPHGTATPVLQILCVDSAPLTLDWSQIEPAGHSALRVASGEPWLTCYVLDDCEVRRLAQVADYYLYPDRILCHILDPDRLVDAEIGLLGAVLARWLERRGVGMLHASAVVTEGGAVAFLATSHGGKSTLAASFVDAGYPLLTDDILPVTVHADGIMAAPGYPQMRMWPGAAAHFLGESAQLPLVHPKLSKRRVAVPQAGWGSFCPDAQPLAAIYLPERMTPEAAVTGATCTTLGRAEALFTLVAHSFAGPGVHGVSHQQARMALLHTVVTRIPVRRLRYPSGFEQLPRVRQAIMHDLSTLAAPATSPTC